MSNIGRTLTLVVKLETEEYPEWITYAHMKAPYEGIRVIGIGEGDQMDICPDCECEKCNQGVEDYPLRDGGFL